MTDRGRDTSMLEGLRIAFVGSGAMGEAMIKGLLARGRVTPEHITASDPVAARREQIHADYGVRTTDDNAAAVRTADVVVLCTPTPYHAGIVHQALDAGCHVVCEKPLTLTVEDSRSVVEHAERSGLHLFPAHVVRYFPQYAAAKQAAQNI